MPRYHVCDRQLPLRDAGLLELASDDLGACELLEELAGEGSESANGRVWTLRFEEYGPFLRLVNHLQRWIKEDQVAAVRCRITYADEEEREGNVEGGEDRTAAAAAEPSAGWVPIAFLFAGVGNDRIADVILNRRFTSFMQPIVRPGGQEVGYEFLLRPLPEQPPFRPADLFAAARESGLHSYLDREARDSAIRLAASHLPQGVKKFVNFLPSSIYSPSSCLERTFRTIRERGLDPQDFVFEVVETERLDDARHLSDIFDVYRAQGIRLAMDDVGEKFATLDVMDRLQPDYVKIDRRWVNGSHADPDKQRHIEEALDRASRFHGVVLAEGVEDERDWRYLAEAGVPLLQGYLFGRPSPVPLPVRAGAV